jgi:hypothetical protein
MNCGNTVRQLLLTLGIGTLVACGGGDGNVAGIGGTGITASGTITGFGSIFVNGVEYETGTASIIIDDSADVESNLRLGMVVTVTGTLNADGVTGTATTVSFDDEVQGPIETAPNDPTGDGTQLEFTVMGIPVLADSAATVFDDGVTFATLVMGDFIEVSGFFDQSDVLHATRIEGQGTFTPGTSEIEIKGMAGNVSGTTFELGSFTVETAGADLSEVTGGVVTAGMQVEVKGMLNGSQITATRVEQEDDLLGDDLDKASIEGIVADFVSNSSFTVSGQPVDASAATFVPASLEFALENGLEVEVEGPIVNGILQAQEVEARGGDVELDAAVESVSVGAGTITLQYFGGMVTVLVNSQTSLHDGQELFDPYTLGHIVATDFLEIRGSIDDNGDIVANEVRRHEDTVSDDIVQGPADSCDGTSISVFGVIFDLVNGITDFEDENDDPNAYADAAAFCADVNSRGLFVKVQDNATVNNGVIIAPADGVADEAELED